MLPTLRPVLQRSRSTLHKDATDWFAAATGSYNSSEKQRLSDFFAVLDTNAILGKIDEMWTFRWGKTSGDGRLGLRTRRAAISVNGPSFGQGIGFVGNRSNTYLNSTFNPAINGSQYTLNNAAITALCTTAETQPQNTSPRLFGVLNTNSADFFRNTSTGGSRMNSANVYEVAANAYTTGWLSTQRISSSTVRVIWDGTVNTAAAASAAIPNGEIYLLCRNNNGTPSNYTDATLAFWAIGAALTAQEVGILAMAEATLRYGWHSDVTAWLNAASGTYSTTDRVCLNGYVQMLVQAGLWTLLDREFLFQFGDNQADAMTCIKTRNTGIAVNSPAWTRRQGFQGNGSSSYVSTGFAPSSGTNFTQNSANFGIYARTANSIAANTYPCYWGAEDSSGDNGTVLYENNSTVNGGGRINSNNSTNFTSSVMVRGTGYYAFNRSSSTDVQVYKDSQSASTTATSSGRTTRNIFIGASNNNGSPTNYSNIQASMCWAGASLSANDWALLRRCTDLFNAAIGFS